MPQLGVPLDADRLTTEAENLRSLQHFSPSLTTMSEPQPSKDLGGPSTQSSIDTKRWWRYPNLRALNLLMIIPLLSIFSQGLVHTTDTMTA